MEGRSSGSGRCDLPYRRCSTSKRGVFIEVAAKKVSHWRQGRSVDLQERRNFNRVPCRLRQNRSHSRAVAAGVCAEERLLPKNFAARGPINIKKRRNCLLESIPFLLPLPSSVFTLGYRSPYPALYIELCSSHHKHHPGSWQADNVFIQLQIPSSPHVSYQHNHP